MKKNKKETKKSKKDNSISLNQLELVHLRNLMSVVPPDCSASISVMLAELTGTVEAEASLWDKVEDYCIAAGIPLGNDAPDFAIVQSAPITVLVRQVEKTDDE